MKGALLKLKIEKTVEHLDLIASKLEGIEPQGIEWNKNF